MLLHTDLSLYTPQDYTPLHYILFISVRFTYLIMITHQTSPDLWPVVGSQVNIKSQIGLSQAQLGPVVASVLRVARCGGLRA